MHWSHDCACTDHVDDNTLMTLLMRHWSRDWSFTDHVAIMHWSRDCTCSVHVIVDNDHVAIMRSTGTFSLVTRVIWSRSAPYVSWECPSVGWTGHSRHFSRWDWSLFWMATKACLISRLLATSRQSLVLVQLAVGPVGPWLVPTPGPVWLWMRVLTTPHLCPFYFSHFGSFFTPLVVGNFFC